MLTWAHREMFVSRGKPSAVSLQRSAKDREKWLRARGGLPKAPFGNPFLRLDMNLPEEKDSSLPNFSKIFFGRGPGCRA